MPLRILARGNQERQEEMKQPKYHVGDEVLVSFPKQGKSVQVIKELEFVRLANTYRCWSHEGMFYEENIVELVNSADELRDADLGEKIDPGALGDTQSYDTVNSPAHYTAYPGIEVIQLTEHMNFCRGNAVKYVARAGLKDKSKEVEDLEKAVWYLNREIQRLKEES